MPTYDYVCSTCGATFEFVQSMKDDALTTCPEQVCQQEVKGKGAITRKITGGTGVIYKGAGFYLTDYVHTKSEKEGGRKESVSEKSEKTGDKSGESSSEKSTEKSSEKTSEKSSSTDSSKSTSGASEKSVNKLETSSSTTSDSSTKSDSPKT
ncbi:MAG: zinc ribbon domain-containing protein [Ignavibacteria bacterium]|nr:zinc ribbon domain-containing protein [Ignavibacteria bacterium]